MHGFPVAWRLMQVSPCCPVHIKMSARYIKKSSRLGKWKLLGPNLIQFKLFASQFTLRYAQCRLFLHIYYM